MRRLVSGLDITAHFSSLSSAAVRSLKAAAENKASAIISNVPWVPQVPPGDWYSGNCGLTSYLMAEAYWYKYPLTPANSKKPLEDMVDWLVANDPNFHLSAKHPRYDGDTTNGVSSDWLARLAKTRGNFKAIAITSTSLSILQSELEQGHPVIVVVLYQGPIKSVNLPNNNSNEMQITGRESFYHYMLVVGMDDQYVYVNDPGIDPTWMNGTGESYAKNRKYTISSFEQVWQYVGKQKQYKGVILYPQNEQLPVGIDAKSLPTASGAIGQSYFATLAALNGKPPYTWSILSGSAPDGLSLTQNGKITGTPTKAGTFAFMVRVTDGMGYVADAPIFIQIASTPVNSPLSISTAAELLDGQASSAYRMQLSASGGTGSYQWSGNLPDGLSLSSDGIITGTPTVAGSYTLTMQLTDNNTQQRVSKEFSLTVLPSNTPPLIYTLTANALTITPNGTISLTCSAIDPNNYSLSYSWTASVGTVSGTGPSATWVAPQSAGSYVVTANVLCSSKTADQRNANNESYRAGPTVGEQNRSKKR